jgi:hypothetical protein
MNTLTRVLNFAGVTAMLAIAFSQASGMDLYISQSGAGANTGLDCADAYPYTFFNSAANWGTNSTQIGPGTTVHLCGIFTGTAGQTLLNAQGSGTAGNPITIKFEPGANLSAFYWSNAGAIVVNGKSFITIDGGTNGTIQNTANGTNFQNHQTSTAIAAQGCSNCEFKNLTIANLYVHIPCESQVQGACSSLDSIDDTQVNCIQFSGSNVLIHDNVMHDTGWCLLQNYTNDSNVQIYNNNIYNMNHGVAMAGANYNVASEFIFNNHFHDMANWDSGMDDAFHHDGIHGFNGSGGGVQNLYIYNNLFDGDEGKCCLTAWVFLEGGSGPGRTPWTQTGTAYVWNNIFIGTLDSPNGQINIAHGNNHLVFNNVIVGAGTGNGICLASGEGSGITIENNIFEGCNQLIGSPNGSTFTTIDYNSYGNASGGNAVWQFGSLNANALSDWQSVCKCDLHSQAQIGSVLKNLSSQGLPAAGFSGLGKGINLRAVAVGNMTSLALSSGAGNTQTPLARPLTGPWDMGAYAYAGAAGPVPLPPTGISSVAH